MSDLPIFKKFVQIFFQKKIWRQQTLPTYDLTYVLNFAVFFFGYASLSLKKKLKDFLVFFVILRPKNSKDSFSDFFSRLIKNSPTMEIAPMFYFQGE